jgi:sulfatase modifying factor 1
MAKRRSAKKISRPQPAPRTSKETKARPLSLSRSDQLKLRKLLKAKTADSLTLAATLLASLNIKATDYRQVFTTELVADLVKPRRGASACETFQNWERLLVAVAGIPSVQRQVVSAISTRHEKVGYLSLSDLTTLSDAAAEVFASHTSQLDLNGLTDISDAVARALARHKGHLLSLNGLAALSESAAKAFATYKGELWLRGLTSISDSVAKMLAGYRQDLELDGLAQISDTAAKALAEHKGKRLSLDGLGSLSDAAAIALSKRKRDLSLNGVATLSDGAAEALARHTGNLDLRGLATLSDAAATFLAKHRGPLSLGGLKHLSESAADLLATNTEIDLPFEFGTKRALLARVPEARREYTKKYGGATTPLIDLVSISPGAFRMGSLPTEEGHGPDEKQVAVRITRPFMMSRTVVTQGQWRAVMGSEPWCHEADGFAATLSEKTRGELFPAVWIDWDLAMRFCTTLTELEREAGRLAATQRYRLPTEAEWEYACRAGTTTAYSFGDNPKGFRDYGWCRENSNNKLNKVGLKKPNPWGLHDMHGNVWEWCSDWYDTALKGGVDPTGPVTDPGHDVNQMVMGRMPSRVIRGGNRYCKPQLCRSAHRAGWGHEGWRLDILVGFRVVCSR